MPHKATCSYFEGAGECNCRKPKRLYEETYKAPGLKLAVECLPLVRHTTWEVSEAYILKAGTLDDGREYQDLRIYLKETPNA